MTLGLDLWADHRRRAIRALVAKVGKPCIVRRGDTTWFCFIPRFTGLAVGVGPDPVASFDDWADHACPETAL